MSTELASDPAADFLAREQETLAGLEDDFSEQLNVNSSKLNDMIADADEFNHSEPLNGDEHLNGYDGTYNGETNGHNRDMMGAMDTIVDPSKPEPEKIRVWREGQQQMLEQKDADESKRKDELRVDAKAELDEWYTRYADQLEKTKLNNRNAEKEWIAERDADKPGQEWDKIAKLCDFNPKSARNTKDTSRMKSILFQLKQQ